MADQTNKPYGAQVVAPADSGGAKISKSGEREAQPDGAGEGVHPAVVNPDQPTFPRPFGVEDDTLREQGVGHAYVGVGSESQVKAAEEQADAEPDTEGASTSGGGEGKPADPDAEAKQKAAAHAAQQHQKQQ